MSMLDEAGLDRGVVVHGGASGWDQGAMVEALKFAPDRLRGIAVVQTDVSDSALADLDAAGVRGVRFTSVAGPTASVRYDGRIDLSDLDVLAPRLRELGWHAQIWANCRVFEEAGDRLRSYGLPIVVDHMGFFETAKGVEDPAFQALLGLVQDGTGWVKLTPFRNSVTGAPYPDVRPFQDALVKAGADQLIWGSDWPFLGMSGDRRPTPQGLLGLLADWLDDADLLERILSRNPARLYGFTR
jgi:predicted TIM-barrel fold metal-dependent hydrolase